MEYFCEPDLIWTDFNLWTSVNKRADVCLHLCPVYRSHLVLWLNFLAKKSATYTRVYAVTNVTEQRQC